jgi:hypothetical protein
MPLLAAHVTPPMLTVNGLRSDKKSSTKTSLSKRKFPTTGDPP